MSFGFTYSSDFFDFFEISKFVHNSVYVFIMSTRFLGDQKNVFKSKWKCCKNTTLENKQGNKYMKYELIEQ